VTAQPDADERRIRTLLVRMGVGPDGSPPNPPPDAPNPPADDDPDAWWDDLYGDDDQPDPEPERRPSPRLPHWWEKKPEQLPDPADEQPKPDPEQTPNTPTNTQPTSPNTPAAPAQPAAEEHHHRQSLLDAWAGITPRTRWLAYHATAAGLGWGLGLVHWSTHVAAWVAADRWTNPQSIACYALGLGAIALYRRTRGWWWPLAWTAAVPVSSTLLGVLLYAPNS
jgi:hypothetical protein